MWPLLWAKTAIFTVCSHTDLTQTGGSHPFCSSTLKSQRLTTTSQWHDCFFVIRNCAQDERALIWTDALVYGWGKRKINLKKKISSDSESWNHPSKISLKSLISNFERSHSFLMLLLSLALRAENDHFSLSSLPTNSWSEWLLLHLVTLSFLKSLFGFYIIHCNLLFYELQTACVQLMQIALEHEACLGSWNVQSWWWFLYLFSINL